MASPSRVLTETEAVVLRLIQEHYGSWNTADEVFISNEDEAVIFVKDADGNSPICVNLTVCGSIYADGSVSLDEFKSDWLRIREVQ